MTMEDAINEIAKATTIEKKRMTNLGVLNEAYDYAKPSSFSRGLRLEFGNIVVLLISGTASIQQYRQDRARGRFPRAVAAHVP